MSRDTAKDEDAQTSKPYTGAQWGNSSNEALLRIRDDLTMALTAARNRANRTLEVNRPDVAATTRAAQLLAELDSALYASCAAVERIALELDRLSGDVPAPAPVAPWAQPAPPPWPQYPYPQPPRQF